MKLIIAEKPSVALAIAKALNIKGSRDGYIENGEYIISWCVGHLAAAAFPEEYDAKYSKWNYADLPIIPDNFKYKIYGDKQKQFKVVKSLMTGKDVSEVINACDAGREGELIFRLVYNMANCKKPIKRLWISSMENAAIREGFENLKDGSEYDNLYYSALCRMWADWIVGINATRLFSILYNKTLNIGRVQTPTLALLCDRHNKIAFFRKEKYFTVELTLGGVKAETERLDNENTAKGKEIISDGFRAIEKLIYPKTDNAESAPLVKFYKGQLFAGAAPELKEKYTQPPKPYTEDTLLSAMETAGAKETADDAERKGLGTPATRAAILEKLVQTGFAQRNGRQITPTKNGILLVSVLPDTLISAQLTAEWENKLAEIAKGESSPKEFMQGIKSMITELTQRYREFDSTRENPFKPEIKNNSLEV